MKNRIFGTAFLCPKRSMIQLQHAAIESRTFWHVKIYDFFILFFIQLFYSNYIVLLKPYGVLSLAFR